MTEPARIPVGWRTASPQAALAFLPPAPLSETGADLPADAGLLARLVAIRAPYDLRLRLTPPGAGPVRMGRVPKDSSLTEAAFRGLVTPIRPGAERVRGTVAVQISLNLHFVTDAPCTLHRLPPFLSAGYRGWPGPLVSGRFPLTHWPRALNAVIEWEDRSRDLVLRRGEAMAYALFAFEDAEALPELVEAADTPALRRQIAGVNEVSEVGRNVGPMFEEARRRRPTRLLVPKETGGPVW